MPSSKRGYLNSKAELEEFAEITVTDETEMWDQISMAEEMIDDYVGYQQKFFDWELYGVVSAASAQNKLTLDTNHKSSYPYADYFKGMHVEIIGGVSSGDLRKITASDEDGELTVESNFTTTLDTTSAYKIYQIGKFPRLSDVFINTRVNPTAYYKAIPEPIRRAVAAQVEYRVNMGDAFFATDGQEVSERIGDYAYTSSSKGGIARLIAPKARHLLRGILNRTGEIVLE